jgi:hypothetical protein
MGLMAKDLDELCVFILCRDLVMDRVSLESNHRIQSCVSYYRYVSFGSKMVILRSMIDLMLL